MGRSSACPNFILFQKNFEEGGDFYPPPPPPPIQNRVKNYFKQLPVPFKIYRDFECILKGVKSSDKNNGSYTQKYQDHISLQFCLQSCVC